MSKLTDFVVDQFTPLQAAQHSLGPWKADSVDGCRSIRAAQGNKSETGDIAYTSGLPNDDEDRANAALIAKAPIGPKLVEALSTITACLSSIHFDDKGKQMQARNALTIARAALAEWDAQS